MRRFITALFLFALPIIAQDNPRETIKTLDDYCIAISKKVDAMDGIDTNVDSILPNLPAVERAKVVENLKSLRALRINIRHDDACDAKDLKSARVATHRDLTKSAALSDEMLAYAKHGLAEAYRQKAQSDGGSNAQK
jgi:hypothetical protein